MKLPVLAGSHLLSAAFVNRRLRSRQNPIAAAIATWRLRVLKFADLSTRLRLLYLPATSF